MVGEITVARAFQYSESLEVSRMSFSNFTGGRESLKVKGTGAILSIWHHPGPQAVPVIAPVPHRLTIFPPVTFVLSYTNLSD